ncbi:MAG TPA: hypothetical protein VG895_02190 [Patescibacteria group bacterium]|nr:hypothetical protein [Patescibacteria group bacterium]
MSDRSKEQAESVWRILGSDPRWANNDWLTPIGQEAEAIFAGVDPKTKIEVACAVHKNLDTGATDIPWTTVFPSDDIDDVCQRLLLTLKTPDYQTPAYDPEMSELTAQIHDLLRKHNAIEGFGTRQQASYHLVQVAAGKPEELFRTFTDYSRRYPQYVENWVEDLTKFYGLQAVDKAEKDHPELFLLLAQTRYESFLSYHPSQEQIDFNKYIVDQLAKLSEGDFEKLLEENEARLDPYAKASYALRGLTYDRHFQRQMRSGGSCKLQ